MIFKLTNVLKIIYWILLFCIMLHIYTLHQRLRGVGDMSISEKIEIYNDEEEILNWFDFNNIERDTVIIIVQVHNRTVYLQNLIDSLSRVKHIGETLIIFSHDYFSEEINQMIRNISFAKVLQIFFPYSIQLHPNQFPGNEVLHGKHIVDKTVRRSDLVQLKHHWWWKANRIFKQLSCLYDHEGMVIFLEEDFYIAEDLVHMVIKMRETANEACPSCEMLVLGSSYTMHDDVKIRNVPKVRHIVDTLAKLKVVNWDKLDEHYDDLFKNFVTLHDFSRVQIILLQAHLGKIAYAFNKTVWLNIVANSELFCNHDDYNWDFSLVNLSEKRTFGPIKILASIVPRVFHLGKCGVHHTNNNDCNSTDLLDKVKRLLQRSKSSMFPRRLSVLSQTNRTRHVNMKNGGFADERDHQLCREMANVTYNFDEIH